MKISGNLSYCCLPVWETIYHWQTRIILYSFAQIFILCDIVWKANILLFCSGFNYKPSPPRPQFSAYQNLSGLEGAPLRKSVETLWWKTLQVMCFAPCVWVVIPPPSILPFLFNLNIMFANLIYPVFYESFISLFQPWVYLCWQLQLPCLPQTLVFLLSLVRLASMVRWSHGVGESL